MDNRPLPYHDNIRRVIFLLLSTRAEERPMVLLTVMSGLDSPLLPVQLLWFNFVPNGIQGVVIAFEPGEGDTLSRKPCPPWEQLFRAAHDRADDRVGFGAFHWGRV